MEGKELKTKVRISVPESSTANLFTMNNPRTILVQGMHIPEGRISLDDIKQIIIVERWLEKMTGCKVRIDVEADGDWMQRMEKRGEQ